MKYFARGFTLVELMVGMVIGLIATLAMMNVMINAEEQKRTTTGGMDAQVNAALALSALTRDIEKAGYGFTSNTKIVGCPLQNSYKGAGLAGMPANLVPLIITPGASGAPDRIRTIFSNKSSFSIPIRVTAPAYAPGTSMAFSVASVRGVKGPIYDISGSVIASGNLMVAATNDTTPCQIFEVTSDPAGSKVNRLDTVNWNPASFPSQGYGDGSVLVNLGALGDVTYFVDNGDLKQTGFILGSSGTASYQTFTVHNNIVQLKALYGKDTNNDGAVDTWDTVTPATNAGWLQLVAVRLAVVSRSAQMEKDPVTFANPTWDVGTADAVSGAATCGSSKCITLKVDNLTDWNKYRYKMFDTTIPLRNMLWKS